MHNLACNRGISFALGLLLLWLAGCNPSRTLGDTILRSEPALTIPHEGRKLVIDDSIKDLIAIYCVNRNGKITRAAWSNSDTGHETDILDMTNDIIPFDYIVVDVSSVFANRDLCVSDVTKDFTSEMRDKEIADRRNAIAEVILFAADHNHTLFMNRVFVFNRTTQMTNKVINTFLNTSEVIAGLSDGGVASGIAGAQLALNSINNEVNASLFFDKSIEAIDTILKAERKAMMLELGTRLEKPIDEYSVSQMMRDLEIYSETSSFRFIAYALQTSANEVKEGTNKLIADKANQPKDAIEEKKGVPTQIGLPTRSELLKINAK